MSTLKTTDATPIISNADASLIDIGDGIARLELHSKLNIIGDRMLEMFDAALDEVETNYAGMIIATAAKHFSVGLNLILLLERAKSQNWDAISGTLRKLQTVCTRLRTASKPVVAATVGMALGGGCELAFGADRVQAFTESSLGLVELRVGLIPAGGGTKEMALRCLAGQTLPAPIQDLFPSVHKAFDIIRESTVSQDAADAIALGYLRRTDAVSSNREALLEDAKQLVLSMHKAGYNPPEPQQIFVLGEEGIARLNLQTHLLRQADTIDDYTQYLANQLAYVLCGGKLSAPQFVTEQYLLDLEHEVFLGLCGEVETHARIEATLQRGKK
ncbi:enoyl-CoA hydratase/isomerase family protein [Candidatus Poribacteria bacterium]|nr:enoyl-CoA hydratase/isomerase family protein [Candidatus Poribacteria bacterium]MYH82537.1 enoyl-CoA hydratase/isomerase family protein [Candidatus Poribacteria bacterium]MYK94469.1 enoyl-CoA hydratase/isomerase family protein [Candidatus Poribacteria bacterium]